MIETSDIQNFIIRWILPALGCIAAAFGTVYIMSEVNPLAATALCASMVFFLISMIAPRVGMVILLGLAGYSDLLKRLLIFLSELSFEQLSYVLAAAPLVVFGLLLALVTRWAFHNLKIERRDFLLSALVVFTMALSFAMDYRESKSVLDSAKYAVNNGLYVAMMPIATAFLSGRDDILRLLRIATVIFIPVAVYGIVQSVFGLAQFEYDYLRTGLTITANEENPRPFSTLNSAGAMGDVTATFAVISLMPYFLRRTRDLPLKPLLFPLLFALVYLFACKVGGVQFSLVAAAAGLLVSLVPFVVVAGEGLPIAQRMVPLVLFALFSTACVCSLVRHSYFLLLASLAGLFSFSSLGRTRVFYSIGTAVVLAIVFSASYLLDNLAAWDPAEAATSEFGSRALGIQTYAERLKGFANLTGSFDMYSLFGLPASEKMTQTTYNHDPISGLLVDYGVIAVLIVLSGFAWMLYYGHQRVLGLPNGPSRQVGVMLLSLLIAVLVSHILFAGVLGTFPVNLFFWLIAGCLVCLITRESNPDQEEADADAPAETDLEPRWALPAEPRRPVPTARQVGQRR